MNEYDDLIKQDQTEALRGAMFAAGSGQPDAEAQLQKLSARTGVPLEAVRIKRQEVEFQDKLNSFDYEKVIKESPKLSAWLSDPKNAALAHDDWQNLSAMEKTFAYAKDYTGALAGGLVGDAVGSTLSGVSTLIDVGARAMDRPVRAAFGDKVANAFWYDAPTIGGISIDPLASLKATGKNIKAAGDWMKPPVDRQNLATDVAGGIGQIGGQIAVQLMTGGAISLGTLYAQGADVMATKTAKDVADPALKDTAILAGGAITAITEKYGLDKLLNRVPPEVKNRTLRFIADKVAAGGIEAGQELAEGLLHDIARRTLTNKDAELLDGVGREMSAAALSAAIVRGALGVKGHTRAKEQEQFIKSLTDTAADSKLRERMPEKFKAYLDSVTAGGPVENIFIPADKFATYFQEAGLDPAAMASKLGVQNYPEASVAGTDVVIPTSEFVTQLSGSDHLQALWGDLRFNQGDMTLNESKQYERGQDATPIDDETLKRMTGVDQARPGFESVKSQIMGELVGRFDRSTAESYATQYAAVITTLAERSGQDPLALAKKYDLSVNMPIPDALRQKLGKVDVEMDPMLDRLRAGDIPKPEKVLGQSLYEFVRDAGGLKDSSEARNMDESIRRKPGQKKIVQPGGMSADAALQYAMEAGYFPGKTDLFETDLLDAMQEDIGGNRVYAPYNGNDAAANEYRMLTEMQAWLDGIGADLATMTNEQVRARIQEVAASDVADVYDQAAPPETGKPIRLFFNRNQESSTQFAQAPGADVGRSVEPAGEYMNVDRTTQLKAPDGRWEAGVVSFQNPLVLAHKSTDSNGWKQDLSEMFGGKTGKALSEAVQAAGHDGIITFDKYGLSETVNLGGEKVAGATTLYQTAETDEATGLPLNSDGTVTVYHHTNAAAAAKIRKTGTLKANAEPDVYVTTRKETDTGYGDTAVAIRVNPDLLQIDDEFPDGRIDFRMDAGKPGGSVKVGVGDTFDQADNTDKRGSITIGADRKMQISLFEKANLSTFLHETGHFYLEVMGDLATADGANPQIQEDYASILQWMGVESRTGIEVKHHEMFARANEAYLMEGKSPSPELQGAFQRFRAWLLHVYKTVAALDVPISDEIRQVFDRMYATDAQIEAAQGENQFAEMFATAADAGMSEAEFKAYSASVQQTIEQGKERLQTKLMGELQRERTKVWKEEREKVRGEVAAEVDAVPVYQAFKALSDGQTEDGIEIKLSRADFIKQYSKEFLKSLPRGFQRIYAAEGGVNIETAAEMFGFDSGKAMVEQLVNMKPRAALVEQMTDDRMKERFGDIRFDGTFADEALNALHNDQRENVLKIELRAIRKKAAEGEMFVKAERARVRDAASAERQSQQDGAQFVADALPQKEQNRTTKDGRAYSFMAFDPEPMRRAAAGIIGQKQIKDLRPYSFLLAERDAAKLGAKAMKAKDYMTAAEQKQRELFNHYLYKEAAAVMAEVERKSGWLSDQGGTKKRQALGKAGADYLEQVDEILERYEFKTVPLNKLARRESLAAWVNAQEAAGNAVAVPEDVLNEARRVNWKQIPVDELRAVFDSVKNITHLASLKNELLVKGQRRNYEEVKQELISSIYAAPLKPTGEFSLPNMKGASLLQRGAAAWKRYDAAHMKIEQIVEWLDDGNIDGAWARNFFDLADSAQTTEYDLHRRVTTVLNDLRLAMPKDWQNALFDRVEFDLPLVTGQGKAAYVKPTRYTLLSIALNMGNEQNAQRLRDGNKLNDNNLQKVRDALTDADWQFVQGVWDSVELLWPDMAALEKRVSGIVPEKVEPAQFSIRGKDYRGGYFPLVYDSRVSAIGEKQVEGDKSIESFLSSGFGRPSTNKGATKKRMETISQPVLLDMNDVLGGHIAKVVKDISHREAVMGLHRILTDEQIKAALIDRLGEAYYREMRDWTKVLVNDRTDSMNAAKGMSKVAMQARTNLAIVTMGWKISTMLSQFAGFGSSADLVKPSYLGRALIQAANSPNETWAMIAEKSGEMRNRVQTIDRDVRDSMRRIADKKSIVADIQRTAFVLTSYADRMVSVPTWLGGYNQAIAEGLGEEAAVRNGDRAVRLSQGAGGAKDLAAVQRNNELMKLMTMYYTPFSALYARLRDIGHQQAVQGIGYLPTAVARSIALVALPAVLGNLLAGRGPDDDEDEVWWSIRQMLMYPIAALPGVRDFSGLMEQKIIALSGEGKMNFAPSYSLSPIVSAIGKAYANLVSKPIDVLAGTREMDAELAWGAFESAGLVAGLPTAQVKITGSYLTDLISGEAQPENAGEVLRDLLFRRKKE